MLQKRANEIGGKKQNFKDYSQVENPFYFFIEPTNEMGNCGRIWKIQCKKCGKYYFAVPNQIISDKRNHGNNPCDCWRKVSKGVLYIKELLIQNNISFVQEKKFDNCLSPKGNCMKFDFYVNNKYIIEYDGEQHFKPMAFYNNSIVDTAQRFKEQQEYDNIKNEYCLSNNISLIRIPYTHYGSIVLEDLIPETSTFLIKGDENIAQL